MKKTFLKTTTILTSVAFIAFASLSQAGWSQRSVKPPIAANVMNNIDTDKLQDGVKAAKVLPNVDSGEIQNDIKTSVVISNIDQDALKNNAQSATETATSSIKPNVESAGKSVTENAQSAAETATSSIKPNVESAGKSVTENLETIPDYGKSKIYLQKF